MLPTRVIRARRFESYAVTCALLAAAPLLVSAYRIVIQRDLGLAPMPIITICVGAVFAAFAAYFGMRSARLNIPRVPYVQAGTGVFVIRKCGEDEYQILLGKRLDGHGEGEYALPGGKIDLGERSSFAAARELYEETGLRVEVDRLAKVGWTDDKFFDVGLEFVTLYFVVQHDACDTTEAVPMIADGTEGYAGKEPNKTAFWGWYDITNLPNPYWAQLDSLIVQNLMQNAA